MNIAVENNVETIAFPNINTGIYKFPVEEAAEVAIETVSNFPDKDKIRLLQFVCFDEENHQIYKNKLKGKDI